MACVIKVCVNLAHRFCIDFQFFFNFHGLFITCRCLLLFLSKVVFSPPWPPFTWVSLARRSQMTLGRCLLVAFLGKPPLRVCVSISLSLATLRRWWWWRIRRPGGRAALALLPSRKPPVLGRYTHESQIRRLESKSFQLGIELPSTSVGRQTDWAQGGGA